METHKQNHIKKLLTGYIVGFVLSLVCTFLAYWMVSEHINNGHMTFPHAVIVPMLAILAISQFIIQLVYFLHLGAETKPRWKQLVFWFMIIIVLIIVVGSIWIMQNLNYNMMPAPENMDVRTQRGGF